MPPIPRRAPESRHKTFGFGKRLVYILVCVLFYFFFKTRPDDLSFRNFVLRYYPHGRVPQPKSSIPFVRTDKSMSNPPLMVDWNDLIFFSIGVTERDKYKHRYLGFANIWMPLPYMPRPGSGRRTALGLCISGYCVCVPDAEKVGKCYSFVWNRGTLLAIILGMQILLYVINTREFYYSFVQRHFKLNVYNLAHFRFWTALFAPFLHTSFFQLIRALMMTASVMDILFDAEFSDTWLMFVFFSGSYIYWLTELVWRKWKESLHGESLLTVSFSGSHAGITALLSFFYGFKPSQHYNFTLMYLPFPLKLDAAKLAVAMALMDVPQLGSSAIVGHASAFLLSQYLFFAYRHY